MEKTEKKLDIWVIFMYLIIYSIAGFLIETIFGMLTKGVVESRKSFLYGPFCAIYGIGAIVMIVTLRNQKSNTKLFFGGAILGAIVEYLMSLICEYMFGMKWWDYSDYVFNINGRTCLFFAVSWGVLAIFLIKFVNPYVDKLIESLREKRMIFQACVSLLIGFFCLDAVLTGYTLKVFYYRIATEKNLNISDKLEVANKYDEIQKSQNFIGFLNRYYDDEKMLINYPNVIIEDRDKNQVYIEGLLKNVKSYYYRLGEV